jgi:hypothetical protein
MKKQVTILTLLLLVFPTLIFGQKSVVEDKKRAEQEMALKKVEEEKKKIEEKNKEIQYFQAVKSEEIEKALDEARIAYRVQSDALDEVSFFTSDGRFAEIYGKPQNSTSMEFSKRLKESSFSKDFTFEVDKDAAKASIQVSGSCSTGEVRIKITMPNGKTYTEVLIDEFGSVNWSKSFSIEEGDNRTGAWKFGIIAKGATGSFRVSVRSN